MRIVALGVQLHQVVDIGDESLTPACDPTKNSRRAYSLNAYDRYKKHEWFKNSHQRFVSSRPSGIDAQGFRDFVRGVVRIVVGIVAAHARLSDIESRAVFDPTIALHFNAYAAIRG